MVRRAAAIGAAALASACGYTMQLPAPLTGQQREVIAPGATICHGSRCRTNFRVGVTAVRIESDVRQLSLEEGAGRPKRSLRRRAAAAVVAGIRRTLGDTTTSLLLERGTMRVAAGDSAPALRCRAVHIDEEARYREDNEEQVEQRRVGDGLRCAVFAAGDSAFPLWRFSRGIAPDRDSLGTVIDTLEARRGPTVGVDQPMLLEQLPFDEPPRRYRFTPDGSFTIKSLLPTYRWLVTRPNGEMIASLLVGAHQAVDFTALANDEERHMLRLVAALVSLPMAR